MHHWTGFHFVKSSRQSRIHVWPSNENVETKTQSRWGQGNFSAWLYFCLFAKCRFYEFVSVDFVWTDDVSSDVHNIICCHTTILSAQFHFNSTLIHKTCLTYSYWWSIEPILFVASDHHHVAQFQFDNNLEGAQVASAKFQVPHATK